MKNLKPKFKTLDEIIQTKLDMLYHNATLPVFKKRTSSDFESDLFDDFFEDHKSQAFEDLKTEGYPLLKYGEVYQWGRGGRTVAQEGLIKQRGGGSFSIKRIEDLDLEDAEKTQLGHDLDDFNKQVADFCRNVEDCFWQWVADNDLEKDIDANKNKKRRTKVVYE